MRILLMMDPGIMIPVKGYGGIERIIEMLAKEYVKLGHEVHLLVTTGSNVEGCTMHAFGKEGFPPQKKDALKAIPFAWSFVWRHRNKFDLIHNFGRLMYLLPVLNHKVKKIMSYQREITRRNIVIFNRLPHQHMVFTGCSNDLVMRADAPGRWAVIYNGCDFHRYQLQEHVTDSAPLIFLGRIEKIKGCHTAIEVAKATGQQLIIAGNISRLPEEQVYFETKIKPHIDGVQILYIGPVNDREKNEWLGKASALLMPINWEEPFGIVMVEAMACGTPVIGYTRGSVREVVEEGVTGFKVSTKIEMEVAVSNIHHIKRKICRLTAMRRFDISTISKKYLALFNDHHHN